MEYVIIGRVIDTFGVKGDLKVAPLAPPEVFESLKKVYLKRAGGGYVLFKVERIKEHGNSVIVKLEGYNSLNEVEQFKGAHLFLPEKDLPPTKEDEFYAYELVGMEVRTDKGKNLGKVKRVEDVGVYSMLILEDEKKMIPFVDEIVLKVSREKKTIEVREDMIVE